MTAIHTYLRSIGFTNQIRSEYELSIFLDNIFATYDRRTIVKDENDCMYAELTKYFGPNMGIRVFGELDSYGFHRQYYFPFLEGALDTTDKEVSVDVRTDGQGFCGMADETKVGVSLIFYLQNAAVIGR